MKYINDHEQLSYNMKFLFENKKVLQRKININERNVSQIFKYIKELYDCPNTKVKEKNELLINFLNETFEDICKQIKYNLIFHLTLYVLIKKIKKINNNNLNDNVLQYNDLISKCNNDIRYIFSQIYNILNLVNNQNNNNTKIYTKLKDLLYSIKADIELYSKSLNISNNDNIVYLTELLNMMNSYTFNEQIGGVIRDYENVTDDITEPNNPDEIYNKIITSYPESIKATFIPRLKDLSKELESNIHQIHDELTFIKDDKQCFISYHDLSTEIVKSIWKLLNYSNKSYKTIMEALPNRGKLVTKAELPDITSFFNEHKKFIAQKNSNLDIIRRTNSTKFNNFYKKQNRLEKTLENDDKKFIMDTMLYENIIERISKLNSCFQLLNLIDKTERFNDDSLKEEIKLVIKHNDEDYFILTKEHDKMLTTWETYITPTKKLFFDYTEILYYDLEHYIQFKKYISKFDNNNSEIARMLKLNIGEDDHLMTEQKPNISFEFRKQFQYNTNVSNLKEAEGSPRVVLQHFDITTDFLENREKETNNIKKLNSTRYDRLTTIDQQHVIASDFETVTTAVLGEGTKKKSKKRSSGPAESTKGTPLKFAERVPPKFAERAPPKSAVRTLNPLKLAERDSLPSDPPVEDSGEELKKFQETLDNSGDIDNLEQEVKDICEIHNINQIENEKTLTVYKNELEDEDSKFAIKQYTNFNSQLKTVLLEFATFVHDKFNEIANIRDDSKFFQDLKIIIDEFEDGAFKGFDEYVEPIIELYDKLFIDKHECPFIKYYNTYLNTDSSENFLINIIEPKYKIKIKKIINDITTYAKTFERFRIDPLIARLFGYIKRLKSETKVDHFKNFVKKYRDEKQDNIQRKETEIMQTKKKIEMCEEKLRRLKNKKQSIEMQQLITSVKSKPLHPIKDTFNYAKSDSKPSTAPSMIISKDKSSDDQHLVDSIFYNEKILFKEKVFDISDEDIQNLYKLLDLSTPMKFHDDQDKMIIIKDSTNIPYKENLLRNSLYILSELIFCLNKNDDNLITELKDKFKNFNLIADINNEQDIITVIITVFKIFLILLKRKIDTLRNKYIFDVKNIEQSIESYNAGISNINTLPKDELLKYINIKKLIVHIQDLNSIDKQLIVKCIKDFNDKMLNKNLINNKTSNIFIQDIFNKISHLNYFIPYEIREAINNFVSDLIAPKMTKYINYNSTMLRNIIKELLSDTKAIMKFKEGYYFDILNKLHNIIKLLSTVYLDVDYEKNLKIELDKTKAEIENITNDKSVLLSRLSKFDRTVIIDDILKQILDHDNEIKSLTAKKIKYEHDIQNFDSASEKSNFINSTTVNMNDIIVTESILNAGSGLKILKDYINVFFNILNNKFEIYNSNIEFTTDKNIDQYIDDNEDELYIYQHVNNNINKFIYLYPNLHIHIIKIYKNIIQDSIKYIKDDYIHIYKTLLKNIIITYVKCYKYLSTIDYHLIAFNALKCDNINYFDDINNQEQCIVIIESNLDIIFNNKFENITDFESELKQIFVGKTFDEKNDIVKNIITYITYLNDIITNLNYDIDNNIVKIEIVDTDDIEQKISKITKLNENKKFFSFYKDNEVLIKKLLKDMKKIVMERSVNTIIDKIKIIFNKYYIILSNYFKYKRLNTFINNTYNNNYIYKINENQYLKNLDFITLIEQNYLIESNVEEIKSRVDATYEFENTKYILNFNENYVNLNEKLFNVFITNIGHLKSEIISIVTKYYNEQNNITRKKHEDAVVLPPTDKSVPGPKEDMQNRTQHNFHGLMTQWAGALQQNYTLHSINQKYKDIVQKLSTHFADEKLSEEIYDNGIIQKYDENKLNEFKDGPIHKEFTKNLKEKATDIDVDYINKILSEIYRKILEPNYNVFGNKELINLMFENKICTDDEKDKKIKLKINNIFSSCDSIDQINELLEELKQCI